MRHAFMAAATLMVVLASPAAGQRMGAVGGKVIDDRTDRPIADAEVSIPALALRATTDSAGSFLLPGVPVGKQIVWVRKIGYGALSAVLTFVAGATVDNEFALVPVVTRLPEVEVKADAPVAPKLSEFEERRKAGFGHFLTAADLAKNEGRRMSEILATIPGPVIVRGTTNAAWIAGGRSIGAKASPLSEMDRRRGAKNMCYSAVILDGTYVYTGHAQEPLWDINSVDPGEIAGIEIYTSTATIPPKYNATLGTCGLVVIWMK